MPVAVGSRVYSVQGLRWELHGVPDDPHWFAHVCSGLSDLGISVVTGHACRHDDGTWLAHVDVDVAGAVLPPESLDVAALAAPRPRPRDLAWLTLTSAQVNRREDGLLVVEVTAGDELGLLGRLLRRVSMLGLEPVEVSAATRTGIAHDRLVLTGPGGGVPGGGLAVQLEQVLRDFLA